jgi:hypothetical protein
MPSDLAGKLLGVLDQLAGGVLIGGFIHGWTIRS